MSKRIHYHKMSIGKYKSEIARYTMIKHKQEKVNKERVRVLRSSHTRYKTDGLNSLQDKVVGTQADGIATVNDLHTGQLSRTLKPTSSNAYTRNR